MSKEVIERIDPSQEQRISENDKSAWGNGSKFFVARELCL